jgi:hypothetical protein
MASLQKHDGYLLIDHRASPGIPAEIARAVGLDPRQCGEGKLLEMATLSCSHCRCCVVPNPLRTRERAYCMKCDHYICDGCVALTTLSDYIHVPYAQLADRVFSDAAKEGSLGSPLTVLSNSTL